MASKAPAGRGTTLALSYTRVSSEEQASEGVSLGAQLAACRAYARGNDWIIGPEFQDVASGSRDDRPQYLALISEVERLRAEGRPVVVLVSRLDRLGRKLLEQLERRAAFRRLGVEIHDVLNGGLVNDLVANLMASVAQHEVDQLAARIRAAVRHVAKSGWKIGGAAPWGYVQRPATPAERAEGAPRSVLEIDEVSAPYVREMFTRVAEGWSSRQAAKWIATLPDAAKLNEAGRTRLFGFSAVRLILANPAYISRQYPGGSGGDRDTSAALAMPRCRWPALIDDAVWAKVQEVVSRPGAAERATSGAYPLTGFLRCPMCGSRMVGRTQQKRGKAHRRYACTRQPIVCHFTTVAAPIEEIALDDVARLVSIAGLGSHRAALRRWQEHGVPPKALQEATLAEKRIKEAEATATLARQRIGRASDMLVDGQLTKTVYDDVTQRAEAEAMAAEAELARLRVVRPERGTADVETILTSAAGWAETLLKGTLPQKREVMRLLVDKVVPIRLGYRAFDVAVHYTPLGETAEKMLNPRAQLRIHGAGAA